MYPTAALFSTGAIQELRVCIDLMAKGYDVYRAISPSAPFDLAIWRHGKLITVEVKSGYDRGGEKLWVPNPTRAPGTVLASVGLDRIEYEPQLTD